MNIQKYDADKYCKRKYILDHLKLGLKNMFKIKNIIITLVMLIASIITYKMVDATEYVDVFATQQKTLMKVLVVVVTIVLYILIIIYIFGRPLGAKKIEHKFQCIGFTNSLGQVPYLIKITKDKNIIKLLFKGNGIPIKIWEDDRDSIEQVLNVHLISIKYENGNDEICVTCAKAQNALPDLIEWDNTKYSQNRESQYVLGVDPIGLINVDLIKFPHLLIAGSTGSGKTLLAKLICMQAINKGEIVYIFDLKGGVDYQGKWRDSAIVVTDKYAVAGHLDEIVNILEERKKILDNTECHNITGYNKKFNKDIKRIVVMIDEAAELLDSTALNKEEKMLNAKIEADLSTIARLGRAFNINLILCTQRPDADILKGQIKNNVDYRICGRADEVLSRVVGVPGADKLVPKDIPGRFMLYDGTIFQSFIFSEDDIVDDSEF